METYTPSPRSIRYHINKYLHRNKERFVNKTVVDLPAGKGILTKTLLEIGAIPVPLDLFPETFEVTGVTCKKADVEAIPLEDRSVDYAMQYARKVLSIFLTNPKPLGNSIGF